MKFNRELELMRNMSANENEETRNDSDELIKIRTKELKYIVASRYSSFCS